MCEINPQSSTFQTSAYKGRDGNIYVTQYKDLESCAHSHIYGDNRWTFLPRTKIKSTLAPDGQLNTYLVGKKIFKLALASFSVTALACAFVACFSTFAPTLILTAIATSGLAISLLVTRELYFFSKYGKSYCDDGDSHHIEHLMQKDEASRKENVLNTTKETLTDLDKCVCGKNRITSSLKPALFEYLKSLSAEVNTLRFNQDHPPVIRDRRASF